MSSGQSRCSEDWPVLDAILVGVEECWEVPLVRSSQFRDLQLLFCCLERQTQFPC